MGATKVLGQSSFWIVNKFLAKLLKSNDCALFLSDMLDKQSYFGDRAELTKDGYFFNTRENIEADTNISADMQRRYIKQLKELNILKTKEMGLPKKMYYKIDEQAVFELLNIADDKWSEKATTGGGEIQPLEVEKSNTNNNKYNNNKTNNINDGNEDNAKEVLEYWNTVTGQNLKSIRGFLTNLGYWMQDYSLEDIKVAIDKISSHPFWRDKMTLETLFRRKNPRGEPVNYISELTASKQVAFKQSASLNKYANR